MTKNGSFWIGMLVGAAAGATTALLTTPKRGSEMREGISQGAQGVGRKAGAAWGDVKDRASSIADSARGMVTQTAGKTKEAATSAKSRAQDAVQAGRQASEAKRQEMQEELEEKKYKASHAA